MKITLKSRAVFLAFVMPAAALLAALAARFFLSQDTISPAHNYTVVLDAGHGGDDPGKVSSSGILEKDINLQITLK